MDLNDFFGQMPTRPDHADFWRLSEIVSGLDIKMDAVPTKAEKDEVYEAAWADIDIPSVTYVAFQRSIRLLGLSTREEVMMQKHLVMAMTTLYMEGVLVGTMFKEPLK